MSEGKLRVSKKFLRQVEEMIKWIETQNEKER